MEKNLCPKADVRNRKDERGAALVTVLMVSFLLLTAVAGLFLEAALNTANVSDATAEEQAYYAAESGIQTVVAILRGNTENGVKPSPLLDTTLPITDPKNRINYFRAARVATSNATTPTTTQCASSTPPADCVPRLSRWMTYNFPTTNPNRVVLGDPATYSPLNGLAYSVTVQDPDNIGNTVAFNTEGYIEKADGTKVSSRRWKNSTGDDDSDGSGLNSVRITYVPKPATVLNVASGLSASDFGKFEMLVKGTGATIPQRARFAIKVNITQPYNTVKVIRGYIEPGVVSLVPGATTVKIFYDSEIFLVLGSMITLTGGGLVEEIPGTHTPTGPYGTYLTGYRVTPTAPILALVPADTLVAGTMTAPEPYRLIIRSTGFGPRGARKQLEAIIQKDYFNGLGAPSPLTLIGPPCTPVATCTASPWNPPSFFFHPGNSNAADYSGKDEYLKAFLPPVGVTNDPNLGRVISQLSSVNPDVLGTPSNIADELPFWLQTPRNLDATIQQLKSAAQASNRYFGPTSVTPNNMPYGDHATGTGITFVDKDLEISGSGGGILVVTGKLTFKGTFSFRGLVIITGAGGFERSGGGNGHLAGNMVVAPYNAASLTCTPNNLSCFLAPRYDLSGGGTSTTEYSSNSVANGLTALSNFVKGVAEK